MSGGADHLLVLPIVLPLAAGALLLIVERWWPRGEQALAWAATVGLAAVAFALLGRADSGAIAVYLLGNWPPPFGIVLALDRLAALLVALTAAVALAALAFAGAGWARRGPHFQAFFQFQLAGLNGAFLTADLFNLFVFFEVLLIASYALLLHAGGGRALRSGYHYVVINLAGSSLFLIAASLFYGLVGTLNLADLAQKIAVAPAENHALLRIAGMLLLVVFAIKAAVLPLGFWLPETYRAAPAPVAALFALMTKVGVYAILRTTTLLFGDGAGPLAQLGASTLFVLGIGTLALGALGALAAVQLRGVVASLVVVSAGTLVATGAVATGPALGGAIYYLLHSTLAAALLFLLVEPIARQRGGVGDRLHSGAPVTQWTLLGLLYLVAAMAIAGLPPLSGFVGKLGILAATAPLPQAPALWAAVLVSGLLATIVLARAGSRIFWKAQGAPPDAAAARILPTELAGVGMLACALLLLAVFAGPAQRYARAAAAQLLDPAAYVTAVLLAEPVRRPARVSARAEASP
ncbi:MAG: monovalent cation/H+ antiporter subunit D [Betaproteobacteria bacterium]|nr:monovalent cation/H+ antiporter subunit D [Betaproteobacteria bacterium]